MNPGKLDRRIVLQRRIVSKDETGSRFETWADESTVWAEFLKQTGREGDLSDAERSQDFQQFRIRYRPLNPTDFRVYYRSKFYDITGISEEGRTESLLLDTVATQSVS
jgi:SPP1 family predicted phage head-tail adaptor